jgi:uncharacterized damage-inducible protein DinB
MEWADAITWRQTLSCEAASTDAFLRERLHHIHTVQWAYLQICRGTPPDQRELDQFVILRSVRDWGRAFYDEASRWFANADDAVLASAIRFPWADRLVGRFGSARPVTVQEAWTQVTSHSTYHRGQVATRLRQLGGEPELTDYVVWLWLGRPEPSWQELPLCDPSPPAGAGGGSK